MFFLKKIISQFLYPVPLTAGLLLFGLMLLLLRWKRAGITLLTFGVLLYCALSYTPIANAILSPLESRHAPILTGSDSGERYREVKWIVVLSGGLYSDKSLPPTSQLYATSLARLVEGVRLYRKLPSARLLLSGGCVLTEDAEGEVLAKAAETFGVRREHILVENASKDTDDQARHIRSLVGDDSFILVTSAAHMPRSIALLRGQGLDPIPAPTDFRAVPRGGFSLWYIFPNESALEKVHIAMHEYAGLAWAKLHGWDG